MGPIHHLQTGTQPIPVTLLTGFLGSGKTTLLNRILNGEHGLRVAVLVNDFGAINIDAQLVVSVESNVISLANGCICCTIREDLAETVLETINRPERPEYILVEASGVAEPSGIMLTFTADFLRDRIRLDSLMCVVDAEQVFAVPELMELKIRQMAFADMIILNKVDLVDRGHIDRIKEWLDSYFHRYRLAESRHGDLPLEVLLSVGRFDPAQWELSRIASQNVECTDPTCGHADHVHDHRKAFGTWTYETDRPVSLEALRGIAGQLPATIYRAKGVIYTTDAPERRAVLQVVGKRVNISLHDEWGERTPLTQIVAIGAAGSIDGTALRNHFERRSSS